MTSAIITNTAVVADQPKAKLKGTKFESNSATREPAWVKYTVLTIALLFFALFLVVPLVRSEEHTSELQSRPHLVCRLLLEKKNNHSHRRRDGRRRRHQQRTDRAALGDRLQLVGRGLDVADRGVAGAGQRHLVAVAWRLVGQ